VIANKISSIQIFLVLHYSQCFVQLVKYSSISKVYIFFVYYSFFLRLLFVIGLIVENARKRRFCYEYYNL